MTILSKFLFFDKNPSKKIQHSNDTNVQPKIRIKKFRMQEEFGPKKFIKP